MQVMYQRCAGIDVHLRFLVVCLLIVEAGQRRKEVRTFRKETADLLALRAWLLEEAGIKLSVVRSSVLGLSGRAILDALCAGESDPERLAKLMHPSVHATREQVVAALTAEVRDHHRFLLRELLSLIDAQDRAIKHLEQEIERHLHPFEEQVQRCEQITGVSRHVLHVLMAEVGTDMQRFPDAEHISSWAGVCPGQSGKCGETAQRTVQTRQ